VDISTYQRSSKYYKKETAPLPSLRAMIARHGVMTKDGWIATSLRSSQWRGWRAM